MIATKLWEVYYTSPDKYTDNTGVTKSYQRNLHAKVFAETAEEAIEIVPDAIITGLNNAGGVSKSTSILIDPDVH